MKVSRTEEEVFAEIGNLVALQIRELDRGRGGSKSADYLALDYAIQALKWAVGGRDSPRRLSQRHQRRVAKQNLEEYERKCGPDAARKLAEAEGSEP